jgi:hypothetical protein
MLAHTLKTAAAIAAEHGQGIILIINGIEWRLESITVVDQPKDLQLCHGSTREGDLLIFDASDVEVVRIAARPDGKRARLPKYPRT